MTQPQPIRIAYDYVIEKGVRINLGFSADIREDRMAEAIVKEAVRCGISPYHVKAERRGDYLHISQSFD